MAEVHEFTSPEVVVSYAQQLFEPKKDENGKDVYGCTFLFNKQNPAHMAYLKFMSAEYEKVMQAGYPDQSTRPRIPFTGHDKSPCKDGDNGTNSKGIPYCEAYSETKGHFFIRVTTYSAPLLIDRSHRPMGKNTIQSGDWVKANLNPYKRKKDSNPGVSLGLNGIVWMREGERIGGGRPAVNAMFGAPDQGADDPSNYTAPEIATPTASPFD